MHTAKDCRLGKATNSPRAPIQQPQKRLIIDTENVSGCQEGVTNRRSTEHFQASELFGMVC